MHKKNVDVVLINLASPIQLGIYEDKKLIETIKSEEKSSDILPELFKEIFEKYEVSNLFYTNGPGSFMAIKVAYIFLKSLSILKKIPLYAVDAFYFNNNTPIKAIGKLYFVKISQEEIATQKITEVLKSEFVLPAELRYEDFSNNIAPLYGIGAV